MSIVTGSFSRSLSFGRSSAVTDCDPYFDNVVLLAPMNGANNAITFTDTSSYNRTITSFGATTSAVQSMFGGSSGFFNGSNNYLTISSTIDFNFSNVDFTVECWVYFNSSTGLRHVFQFNGTSINFRWNVYVNGLRFILYTENGSGTGGDRILSSVKNLDQWYFLSVVRKGNTTTLYVDGQSEGTTTTTVWPTTSSQSLAIGTQSFSPFSTDWFSGYIDDFRVTRGIGRYSNNFSVPSSQFPNCESDSLTFTTPTTISYPISLTLDSAGTFSASNTVPYPISLTLDSAGTFSSSNTISYPITLQSVVDPYFANVSLLLHMDGTSGSNTFVDSSVNQVPMTAVGNIQINTNIVKYGTGSASFDGNNDFISFTQGSIIDFSNRDYTVELWANMANNSSYAPFINSSSALDFGYNWVTNQLRVSVVGSTSTVLTANTALSQNTWSHIAISRSAGSLRAFVNGMQVGTTVTDSTSWSNSPIVRIGGSSVSANNVNGYIDDLRITKGFARYTTNFTPPTQPFPDISTGYVISGDPYYDSTVLLAHMNGSNNSVLFVDNGVNELSMQSLGNAITSNVQSQFDGSSGYFNGSTSYVEVTTSNNSFVFGTGDITVEWWMYIAGQFNSGGPRAGTIVSTNPLSAGFNIYLNQNTSNEGTQLVLEHSGNYPSVNYTFLPNTWYSCAVTRKTGTLYFFVNGTLIGTQSLTNNITSNQNLIIGQNQGLLGGQFAYKFNGYIDELRITKGIARYTQNYSVQTQPFPNQLGTMIPQTNFSATVTSGLVPLTVQFTDNSLNIPTSWLWDFKNDGTATSTTQNPSYTYTSGGTYSVKLTATNAAGSNTSIRTNYINVTDSDIYMENVSLLLHMSGGVGSNTFIDTSWNQNTVLPIGNVQISNTQSKFANTSAYFDGTGDYLSIVESSNFGFGTGDFCLECWVNTLDTEFTFFDNRTTTHPGVFFQNATGVGYFGQDVGALNTNFTVNDGAWHHVAFTRASGTLRIFIDGVQRGSWTMTSNLGSSRPIRIGDDYQNGSPLLGYLDDVRITKGQARYTTNFTPPQQSFPDFGDNYFGYVSLLLHMDGTNGSTTFTDNSLLPKTITAVGGAQANTSIVKFGTSSAAFNGSTTYLTVPHNDSLSITTNDFTVECWIYIPTIPSATQYILNKSGRYNVSWPNWSLGINSTGNLNFVVGQTGSPGQLLVNLTASVAVTPNTWTHIAATKQSTTYRIFVNGALSGTSTVATTPSDGRATALYIGSEDAGIASNYFNGYIDDLRVSSGIARYTADFTPPSLAYPNNGLDQHYSNVTLLLHNNGANTSTYFADNSTSPLSVTAFGNAQVSTSVVKYGNGSLYLDGNGDYLRIPYNSNLELPGDFTIELWVYPVSRVVTYPAILSTYSTYSNNGGLAIFAGHGGSNINKYDVALNGSHPVLQSTSNIVYNSWTHLAIVRSGSTIRFYINGTSEASTTSSVTVRGTQDFWWIGTSGDAISGGWSWFNGYIDELRVTKGVARYTANFTPPALSFPNA